MTRAFLPSVILASAGITAAMLSSCANESVVHGAPIALVVGPEVRFEPAPPAQPDPREHLETRGACTPTVCLLVWLAADPSHPDRVVEHGIRVRLADLAVLDPTPIAFPSTSRFVVASDDTFLLVGRWLHRLRASDGAILDPEGTFVGATYDRGASDGTGFLLFQPETLTIDADGSGISITYGAALYRMRVSATGALLDPEETELLRELLPTYELNPIEAIWDGSSYLVVYERTRGGLAPRPGDPEIHGVRLSRDGDVIGGTERELAGFPAQNGAAALGPGGFAILYEDDRSAIETRLMAATFDDDGDPAGDPIVLVDDVTEESADLVYDGTAFTAIWSTEPDENARFTTELARFLPDGTRLDEPPIRIDEGDAVFGRSISGELFALGDGRSLLAAIRRSSPSEPWYLSLRVLETTPDEVPDGGGGGGGGPPMPPLMCAASRPGASGGGAAWLVAACALLAIARRRRADSRRQTPVRLGPGSVERENVSAQP